MIKRILVALDPDSDTPVATKYAVEIAQRFGARVTGLAVVDMGSIESSAKGGGVGSMYYAEKLRENLTAESRERARNLALSFRASVEETGIEHTETVGEGVPFRRIVEDMKYHDLLILGNDPHFFYSHPKHQTHTLARVIENTVGPTLVVSDKYRTVQKVLFAFDGTNESSRAIRRFIHLHPFGTDLKVRVLSVQKEESSDSKFRLKMAKEYLEAHGFETDTRLMIGAKAKEEIMNQAESFDADMIVMGAHIINGLTGVRLGDSTTYLLENADIPLLLDH
jgi:nucleotide-binding universal stress UspA family protein